MREQVGRAREAQRRRWGGDGAKLNSRMTSRGLRAHCALDDEGRDLLKTAMEQLGLSARAHDRILRVARTIADLEGAGQIRVGHLHEAIGYRSLDRKLWARCEGVGGERRRPQERGPGNLLVTCKAITFPEGVNYTRPLSRPLRSPRVAERTTRDPAPSTAGPFYPSPRRPASGRRGRTPRGRRRWCVRRVSRVLWRRSRPRA